MQKICLERCQYNLVEIVCSLVCSFGVVSLSSVFFFVIFYFFMSCIFSLRGDLNVEGLQISLFLPIGDCCENYNANIFNDLYLLLLLFQSCTLYVEMTANGMFGAGKDGLINAPDPKRHYTLSMAEIAVFDAEVYEVLMDLTVIIDLAKVRNELK